MKIVITPSGFKECLDAEEVAKAMESGIHRLNPHANITVIPMIDGGEGFAKTIVKIKKGRLYYKEVTGPVGETITIDIVTNLVSSTSEYAVYMLTNAIDNKDYTNYQKILNCVNY